MKRGLITSVIAVVSFVLGVAVVFYLKRSPVPQDWLTIIPDTSPISWSSDAMTADIPLPDFGKPVGRVKFLQRDKGIQIGYVLKLPITPDPVSALPPKYRQQTKLPNGLVIGPPDQVIYTGKFTFNLEDGDGFSIAKITSPDETVAAASDNSLQGMTDDAISESIAERTKKIAVSFYAAKCNPCGE